MQQFPFTLRQFVDRTRDHLQAEMFEQQQKAATDKTATPQYSSGEVLTLHHEAAMRALVELSEGSYAEPVVHTLMRELQAADRKQAKAKGKKR